MKIKVYMKELQYRLFFTFFCFVTNACVIYIYKDQLIFLLGQHQNNSFPYFITTNLPEIFLCFLKLSLSLGVYFSLPLALMQCWLFLSPALYKYEHKTLKSFFLISTGLFAVGTFTVFKILLPYCWEFFSTFQLSTEKNGIGIHLETRLYEYLSFFIQLLYTLNITINFSIFLSFLLIKFPINTLVKLRKIIYLFCFLLATIITPPDIISQVVTGLLLVALYEAFFFALLAIQEYKKGE